MKLLAFVDLHEDTKTLRELLFRAQEDDIDLIICAGDFSTFGRGMRNVLKAFSALGKEFLVIPGNHEERTGMMDIVQEYPHCHNLHEGTFEKAGYIFLGYGGNGFSMEDPHFRSVAREWYGKHKTKKIVLVTHGSPFGTTLDLLGKRHVGNKDYRRFIERIHPRLVIAGHLHETAGAFDTIRKTRLVNPGWEGMVIELR